MRTTGILDSCILMPSPPVSVTAAPARRMSIMIFSRLPFANFHGVNKARCKAPLQRNRESKRYDRSREEHIEDEERAEKNTGFLE